MKFHSNEIKGIWNIVAAILHLGNVTMDEKTLDTQKNVPCTIENEKLLGKISELLFVDSEKLKNALTVKTRKIGGQIYKTCITKIDCLTIKYLFFLLFIFFSFIFALCFIYFQYVLKLFYLSVLML